MISVSFPLASKKKYFNFNKKILFFKHSKRQSAAKVNNFMRLEPMINLLEIPFNTNIARDIMQEKKSTATQLLYQVYIALTNKQKRNLTGMAMETMRPQGPVKLEQFESKIYQNVKDKEKF